MNVPPSPHFVWKASNRAPRRVFRFRLKRRGKPRGLAEESRQFSDRFAAENGQFARKEAAEAERRRGAGEQKQGRFSWLGSALLDCCSISSPHDDPGWIRKQLPSLARSFPNLATALLHAAAENWHARVGPTRGTS